MSWDNLEGLPAGAYNQQFMQKLAQDPEALRMVGDNFVRDRLREDMVFNGVIPQTPITPEKLQIALETDTMFEVVHLDPNAAAAIVDFRGPGRGQVVRAPRVALGFHMLKSDEFEVVEQELLVYPYPIVRLVHEYSIKAIGDQHDLYMLQNAKRAVDFVEADITGYKNVFGGGIVFGVDENGASVNAVPTTDKEVTVNTPTIVRGKKNLSNRIEPDSMIIAKKDHDDIDALDVFEQGDVLRSDTFISGYRQATWTGLKMIVTTKADVFTPGNIWIFAKAGFLGKNRVLDYGGNAYKLFIDRRSNVITWHVYVNVGAIFPNVGSIVQLKLYSDKHEELNPKKNPLNIVDDDLFQQRNLAEQGGRFPNVRQF